MIDVSRLIVSSNYMMLNDKLVEKLGVNQAIMFTYLLTRFSYFRELGKLESDGSFYFMRSDVVKKWNISKRSQVNYINEFESKGLLKVVIRTEHKRSYCLLDLRRIEKIFHEESHS